MSRMMHQVAGQSGVHSPTGIVARTVPSPLPRARAALFESFSRSSPAPNLAPSAPIPAIGQSKMHKPSTLQHMSRSYLQNDEHCQQSSDLRQLLGMIFAYSDRYLPSTRQLLETTANLCYFLPNGRLAHEWIYFFDIVPDRYRKLAPPQVLHAYCTERSFTPSSMRGWVEDEIDGEEMKEANQVAQVFIAGLTPVSFEADSDLVMTDVFRSGLQHSSRKRKFEGSSEPDPTFPDELIDPRLRPATANHLRLAVAVDKGNRVAPIIVLPDPRTHQIIPQARIAAQAQVAAPAQAAPAGNTRPVLPVVQAPPPGSVQQPPHPQNPMHIPHHRQARSHPSQTQAPGSVTHVGRGHVVKAWSTERVRAFTNIQGYPLAEIPVAAVSPYGDELSRNQTPASIDPRCCPFDTTMEENLTYMTLATTTNRELCARAKRSWTASDMVYYVYHALDLRSQGAYDRTRLQKQFLKCAQDFEATHPQHVLTASMSNLCMDSGLTGDNKYVHDFYLHAMGANVVIHPTGHAAQMLTRVIGHAVRIGDRNTRLSQAAQFAHTHGITVPAHQRMNTNLSVADQPDPVVMATARAAWHAKFPGQSL